MTVVDKEREEEAIMSRLTIVDVVRQRARGEIGAVRCHLPEE